MALNNPNLREHNKATRIKKGQLLPNHGGKGRGIDKFMDSDIGKTLKAKLSKSEIRSIIQSLLEKTVDELKEIATNPNCPVIVQGYAASIIKQRSVGKIDTIETILDRAIGKATIITELTGDPDKPINIQINDVDTEILQRIINQGKENV